MELEEYYQPGVSLYFLKSVITVTGMITITLGQREKREIEAERGTERGANRNKSNAVTGHEAWGMLEEE